MARHTADPRQGDLLGWQAPSIVQRYDDHRVRAYDRRAQIALAVKATLDDCALSRDEIAARMSNLLAEDVSKAMLDAYASVAKVEHTISFLRVEALCEVTGDDRLIQMSVERRGKVLIEDRYLGAVEAEIAADRIEQLEIQKRAARRRWKGWRP